MIGGRMAIQDINNSIAEVLTRHRGYDSARYTMKQSSKRADEYSSFWFYMDGRLCGRERLRIA